MDEAQVRTLVREALARHIGREGAPGPEAAGMATPGGPSLPGAAAWKTHLSHGRFVFLAPTERDAPCIVEPQVRCHHCGFCQSYGH